jgi:hypothetical protein
MNMPAKTKPKRPVKKAKRPIGLAKEQAQGHQVVLQAVAE